jgi:hypothetical protein
MRSLLLVSPVAVLVMAVGAWVEESKTALTPAEAIRKCGREPSKGALAVKYRVKDVAESNPEWTYLYADEMIDGNLFAVQLSRAAKTALKRRGISDLTKRFVGQEITAQGRIEVVTLWCFPVRDLYTMRVDSLEQLLESQEADTPIVDEGFRDDKGK